MFYRSGSQSTLSSTCQNARPVVASEYVVGPCIGLLCVARGVQLHSSFTLCRRSVQRHSVGRTDVSLITDCSVGRGVNSLSVRVPGTLVVGRSVCPNSRLVGVSDCCSPAPMNCVDLLFPKQVFILKVGWSHCFPWDFSQLKVGQRPQTGTPLSHLEA